MSEKPTKRYKMVDDKNLLKDVKNPDLPMALLGAVLAIIGALFFAIPSFLTQFGAYGFYFRYFGGIFVIIGLFSAYHYGKKAKDFKHLLASDEEKILWFYNDERYEAYVSHLQKAGLEGNKQKLILLFFMTAVMMAILFFVLPKGEKLMVYIFAVGMFLVSALFLYVFPLMEIRRIKHKPYCTIITADEALNMGTYHRWKECKAKVKEGLVPGMTVLAFTYEGMTVNGRMTREWHALLPSEDQETVEEARKMMANINKKSKEKDGKKQRSLLDRLILKALNRDPDQ